MMENWCMVGEGLRVLWHERFIQWDAKWNRAPGKVVKTTYTYIEKSTGEKTVLPESMNWLMEWFLRSHDGALPPLPQRGRPKDKELRLAAWMADIFYVEWRASNKELGAPDHGHGDEMRTEAARFIVEDFVWDDRSPEFMERVRNLMGRPKSRREPAEGDMITKVICRQN